MLPAPTLPSTLEDRCVGLWDELVRREGSPADAIAVLLAFAVAATDGETPAAVVGPLPVAV